MSLHTLAEWLTVALALMFVAGIAGLGLARFLVLQEKVDRLDYWFNELQFAGLDQEQDGEVLRLAERVDFLEYQMCELPVPVTPVESGEVA